MRDTDSGGVKIVYTATRTIPRAKYAFVQGIVHSLSALTPVEFISGCAPGGDTILAEYSYEAFPDAIHRLIVPRDKHNVEHVENFRRLQEKDKEHIIIEVCPVGPKSRHPLLYRNDYMLTLGEILVALPKTEREEKRGSGTWACIRSARKALMPTRFYPVWRGDPWIELPPMEV